MLEKAAASPNGADAAWVAGAEELLGTDVGDQQQKNLEVSLAAAQRVTDTSSYSGWWWYNIGTIQLALHHDEQARDAFKKALLLPDSLMSHHLSRAALADSVTGR
jgi:hypothetical protein